MRRDRDSEVTQGIRIQTAQTENLRPATTCAYECTGTSAEANWEVRSEGAATVAEADGRIKPSALASWSRGSGNE